MKLYSTENEEKINMDSHINKIIDICQLKYIATAKWKKRPITRKENNSRDITCPKAFNCLK